VECIVIPYTGRIELVLTTTGRFRWAACQLDTLAQCVTRGKVRRALKDLPKTLDDTYARILRAIDEGENAEEALKILRWLAHSERPLTANELLEVTGIFTEDDLCEFDEDEVLGDSRDILRICSSLVSITSRADGADGVFNDDSGSDDQSVYSEKTTTSGTEYVRLAHFSVKEYLVSNRPCIPRYSLQSNASHDTLASCCLVYLLRFNKDELREPAFESEYPLAHYAARFWTQHARTSQGGSQRRHSLSLRLLTEGGSTFSAWIRLFDISRMWNTTPDIHREIAELPSPLYAASHEGIEDAVSAILNDAHTDVNSQWGDEGNALYAASEGGHEKVVEMLLAKGADVNAQGGLYGNALQVASVEGHEKVVEILLAKGVDVNAQGGLYGNALQAASARGREKVVEMLLAKGADVNAQGGTYGNALQAASARGHEKVVKMLLAKGADINAQGGRYGNALRAASARGHEKITEILLANGPKPLGLGPE
jgi:hypothetical protein